MSQENVDRFRGSMEAFNRGDVEGWLQDYHPDVVVALQDVELEGEYSGHDGLRRFFASFAESFEMFEVHYSDVRDLGDQVLGLGTLRTTGRGSGIRKPRPSRGGDAVSGRHASAPPGTRRSRTAPAC